MANILKITANTRAYLTSIYNAVEDKFDVLAYRFNYGGAVVSEPWGYWKFEEVNGLRIDSSGNSHDLTESNAAYTSRDSGLFGYCVKLASFAVERALQWLDSYPYGENYQKNTPFSLHWWGKMDNQGNEGSGVMEVVFPSGWIDIEQLYTGPTKVGDIALQWGGASDVNWTSDEIEYDYTAWTLYSITMDGTYLRLYINTTEVYCSDALAYQDVLWPWAQIEFHGYEEVDVWFDEAVFYKNKCFTPAEIAYYYNGGAGMPFVP